MVWHHAPCILLFNRENQSFSLVHDRNNIFEQYQSTITSKLLKMKSGSVKETELFIGDRLFDVSSSSLSNNEILYIILPHIEKGLFEAVEMEKTLRDQQQRLFDLAKAKTISKAEIQSMLRELCETISLLINCDRVGIWIFNEDQTILTCRNLYDRKSHRHLLGVELESMKMPRYFKEIVKNRSLAVTDTETDSRVADLNNGYFQQMGGVKSLLDVPLILSKGIGGVLCCESFSTKSWSELDQTIAGMLADMVSFIFERINWIEEEGKMLELAYIDPLTGLSNHHAFLEQVDTMMNELKPGEKRLMVYLQLDQFNSIQDVLGYSSGDEVILTTARRLQESIQSKGLVSRIGFGHFALFLPASSDGEVKCVSMEEIAKNLHAPMFIQGQDVYVTHSYGVSIYPDHGQDANKCIQMAQVALNTAKKKYARSVQARFTEDMINMIEDDLLAEMNLRKGLDLNEFELYYQPKINSFTGEIIGFEALIRWNHPEKGLIPPLNFIELAESTGLIMAIDEWVIENAFKQLEKWKECGENNYTLSINISPRHFLHSRLNQFLKECLDKYEVNPCQFVIEITENVAMEDFERVKNRIAELQNLGFSVSIDDFGTGFSAFHYLQHFPIQEIKIDRQFIRDIANNEVSKGIAKTIIDLAKLLNLNVVSEGVETIEQWRTLKKLGCPQLQGFYFSKPMPITELDSWLTSHEQGRIPLH
ncbi:EAL domain-containing protein [Lederbergia wuyishanensis]|uniref:Diguanylate cyclase (GGDEF)-like protein n=1 Tax=Lederbergia wuyishanensis TaxID=1347903 RepID=A0ABU0D8R1_9BACI|nr:sensor domain-containing phosphodiesterase [Lederbergia wuyishanensis]MCJ8007622.1 sensor domain-containing phosphodiesterase [Lederbergia wuyishanensis]MDQ0344794.1 diguanylate cyclase (GGDEF)-like protein [Lederbergia wuyishanensis]